MSTEKKIYTQEELDTIQERLVHDQRGMPMLEDAYIKGGVLQAVTKKIVPSWTATEIVSNTYYVHNYFKMDGFSFVMCCAINYQEEVTMDMRHVDEYRKMYADDDSKMKWIDSLVPVGVDEGLIQTIEGSKDAEGNS